MRFSSSPFTHAICLLLLVLSISNARLVVKAPEELKKNFDGVNGIDYTILTPQNKITYKRAFIGSVTLAENPTACDPLPSLSGLSQDAVYNPVLLTTWGDCHYAQKVKNAEMAGAKMVILVLRHDMDANHPTVRQLPINTNVEVLSISKTDGDILVDYITRQKSNGVIPTVEITYSYDVEKHLNFQSKSDVILDFWFSSADTTKASYQFLETLKDIMEDFGDKVKFFPHYVLWQYDEESTKHDPRCVSNGLYCDPEPMKDNKLCGEQAVMEDLRQILIREQSGSTTLNDPWWKYVLAFGDKCVDKDVSELEECRQSIYMTLPSSAIHEIDSGIRSSFKSWSGNSGQGENDYLDREVLLREEMSVDHYPAFYVNKARYTLSFRNKYNIKEFICSHFLQDQLPATCVETVTATQTAPASSSDTLLYVLIVIVSILVMAIMLYCVRRTVKRQVMTRMNDEISHIVTQYKQFKDKSNSFSADEDM